MSFRKSPAAKSSGLLYRLVEASAMSARKNISVSRTYRHEADDCLRALILLLEKPVCKKGGSPTAPDNARKESEHVSREVIIPERG